MCLRDLFVTTEDEEEIEQKEVCHCERRARRKKNGVGGGLGPRSGVENTSATWWRVLV